MLKKVFLLVPAVLTAGFAQAQFRIGARAGFNLKNLAMVFALLFSVSFISCNKDDDGDIVGSWKIVHDEGWYMEEDGEKYTFDDIEDVLITFTADGKYTTEQGSGTWSFSNNKLTMNYGDDDEPDVFDVIKLTATEMILEIQGSYYYDKMTLKKQ